MSEITRILHDIERGEPKAAEELLPLVYAELRQLAAIRLAREAPGNTLQPTALVHEAWLRLVGDGGTQWNGRGHFFGAAAEAMRRILVDRARRKRAVRHGGSHQRIELEGVDVSAPDQDDQLIAVSEALELLATHDPTIAELVKLRYFAGLTIEETSRVLNISEATTKRRWVFAKAWLNREIRKKNEIAELTRSGSHPHPDVVDEILSVKQSKAVI